MYLITGINLFLEDVTIRINKLQFSRIYILYKNIQKIVTEKQLEVEKSARKPL